MAFTKYILPFIAAAGIVSAASNCPDTDTDGTVTIQNQGDAAAFASCTTFNGSITIASSTVGSIALDGVEKISGNLTVFNATSLNSISAGQLTTIGGYFHLEEVTTLTNLQFSSLTSVNIINFIGLPNLQGLNFGSGVQQANGVRIVNTYLTSLSGIELNSVSALEVTNNPFLTEINVNNLASIDNYITLAANAADLTIEFPNLVTAANMTFRNVSSIAVPSLANVTGSFGCYSDSIQTFSAANLTFVGNALVFDDNSQLTNISLPQLTSVGGGYQIANNTKLKIIDGFTKLKTVGGALDFSGAFTNVSLPALNDVKGGFNMQSTSTLDCSAFDSDHSSKIIKGTYVCSGSLAKAGTQGTTPTTTSSSSSASSTTKANGAVSVQMNKAAVGLAGAVVGLMMI